MDFLLECVRPVNLPFTILLFLAFVYWLFFLLGAVGLDLFDIGADTGDVDIDAPIDPDIPTDDVPVDTGGAFMAFLGYFNFGDVPLTILLSVLVFNLWAGSLLGNYYLDDFLVGWSPFLISVLWLVPNMIIGLFLTKFVTYPFKALFRDLKSGVAAPVKIVGQTCIITTSEATPEFGRAEVRQEGSPITINVRTKGKVFLTRGDEAMVVARSKDPDAYLVVPFHPEIKK